MNILYFFQERETYMYQWQRIHIFDELLRDGHKIEVYNPLLYSSSDEANQNLIPFIKRDREKYDLFMTCEGGEYIYKESIEEVKKLGLSTLLICFDNLHAPYMHKKIASSFDVVWLTSKETISMFKKWGCNNIIFQTYAANPYQFKPNWDKPEYAVSFIGNPYGSRVNKLNVLTQANVLCKVYSDSFIQKTKITAAVENIEYLKLIKSTINALSFSIGRKVFRGALKNKYFLRDASFLNRNKFLNELPSVSFLEMQKIYSNSSLSLNITELRNTYVLKNPIHKMHLRTFEIPMCGGLAIAPYTEELAGYFEEDKEIILYKTDDEFISKSKFYLDPKNESICLQMKKKARERAVLEHTWSCRFEKIFNEI
jgi:spore maturation protein CgeB